MSLAENRIGFRSPAHLANILDDRTKCTVTRTKAGKGNARRDGRKNQNCYLEQHIPACNSRVPMNARDNIGMRTVLLSNERQETDM